MCQHNCILYEYPFVDSLQIPYAVGIIDCYYSPPLFYREEIWGKENLNNFYNSM